MPGRYLSVHAEHKIEQTASVYLQFRDGQWIVDPVTVDGYALDAVHNRGPLAEACGCDDETACEAARQKAADVPLPTGHELARLLDQAAAHLRQRQERDRRMSPARRRGSGRG